MVRAASWDSVEQGVWITSPVDDHAALAAACLRLARGEPSPLEVVLIGSSASREALEQPHAVAFGLAAELGVRPKAVQAHGLFAGDLRPVELLSLADCLPPALDGLVVLSISPQALSEPEAELDRLLQAPRLPLSSEALEGWMQAQGRPAPRHTGLPMVDHPAFFLARPQALGQLVRATPVEPAFHQVDEMALPSQDAWEELIVPRLQEWVARYPERSEANLGLYAAMIQDLQRRGAKVALQDAPRNPDALAQALRDPADRAMLDRYEADVAAFAEAHGAAWIQPQRGLTLSGQDFLDHSHIRTPEGRGLWTQALVRDLAAVLRASGWTPPPGWVGPPPTRPRGQPGPPPGGPK